MEDNSISQSQINEMRVGNQRTATYEVFIEFQENFIRDTLDFPHAYHYQTLCNLNY